MPNLSREGHRQRLRDEFLNGGFESMPDYKLVELLLTYAIPRKDVKEISYELFNTFGTLENIFNADVSSLTKVNGIGKNTAVLLKLHNIFNKRVASNKSVDILKFDSVDVIKQYYQSLMMYETVEKFYVTTLNNSNEIIETHLCNEGTVNHSPVNIRKIVEFVIKDSASSIVIAHNHPNGHCEPSKKDLNLTMKLRKYISELKVNLIDHVIVGEEGVLSMRSNVKYMIYLKEWLFITGLI